MDDGGATPTVDRTAQPDRVGAFGVGDIGVATGAERRIPMKAIRAFYIGLSLALMLLRSVALFSWAIWHLIVPPTDMAGHPISYVGTFVIGLGGTMLMPFLWPIGFGLCVAGRATFGSVFLYPWFALAPH